MVYLYTQQLVSSELRIFIKMTSKYLITLCLILCVVVQGKQTKDMEDCIANTSVMTDNAEVVANAIGNAVTSVNGATVQCENGLTLDEEDTSGIAVAVSTAVSTTMDAEANCTVNANANANGPFSVKDIVGSSMEMGFAMACIGKSLFAYVFHAV